MGAFAAGACAASRRAPHAGRKTSRSEVMVRFNMRAVYGWTTGSYLANMLIMKESEHPGKPSQRPLQKPSRPPNALFRALADETRRDILEYLRAGPRTSGEIAAQFRSTWPTISRHLAVLRAGGLVVSERKGQAIYYELNTSVFQDLVQHLVGWVKPLGQAAPGERPLLKARRTQQA